MKWWIRPPVFGVMFFLCRGETFIKKKKHAFFFGDFPVVFSGISGVPDVCLVGIHEISGNLQINESSGPLFCWHRCSEQTRNDVFLLAQILLMCVLLRKKHGIIYESNEQYVYIHDGCSIANIGLSKCIYRIDCIGVHHFFRTCCDTAYQGQSPFSNHVKWDWEPSLPSTDATVHVCINIYIYIFRYLQSQFHPKARNLGKRLSDSPKCLLRFWEIRRVFRSPNPRCVSCCD